MQTISVDVIKRVFGLKPKKVIPVSELTIEDVLSGKYFSVFRPSDSMAKTSPHTSLSQHRLCLPPT